MELNVFLNHVKDIAHLGSRDEAMQASCATLETLAERLKGGEPGDLGSQLPAELARCLHQRGAGTGERFDVQEFVRRVGEREGLDAEAAHAHVRAVFGVLMEAISEGEIDDIRAQLPAEYHHLLEMPTRH